MTLADDYCKVVIQMNARDNSSRRRKRQHAETRKVADRIRQLVRADNYYPSKHVFDKIAQNDYLFEDIKDSILSGTIDKVERDEVGDSVDGKKYTFLGRTRDGILTYTVGKIVEADDGKLYFVITIY